MNNKNFCNMQQKAVAGACCVPFSRSALPNCPVVAMAYVPLQTDCEVYSSEKGLSAGTLFPILDKPFKPGCC